MLAPESGVHIFQDVHNWIVTLFHILSFSFCMAFLSWSSIQYNLSRKENLQAVKLSSCMPSTPAVSLLHRSSQFNFAANIVHTIHGPLETEETQNSYRKHFKSCVFQMEFSGYNFSFNYTLLISQLLCPKRATRYMKFLICNLQLSSHKHNPSSILYSCIRNGITDSMNSPCLKTWF